MILPTFTFLLNILLISSKFCYAIDNFTSIKFLKDQDTIVSNNSFFRLGFFSPPNSTNRYVGIWYNQPSEMEVIWVANRDNPVTDSSGVLKLSVTGNLVITNARNQTLWSSNVTNPTTKFSVARLSDYGNLVIQGFSSNVTRENGTVIWQSFVHPTDSVLPDMRFVLTSNSDLRQVLQAWSGPSDPSIGRFSIGTNSLGLFEITIFDGDQPYWRSGPWNGNIFIGTRYSNNGYGNILVNTGSFTQQQVGGMLSLIFAGANATLLSHYVLTSEGVIAQRWWDDSHKNWEVSWHAPENECDTYAKCGEFGICSPQNKQICSCLKGFEPKNKDEWKRGNWTSGCQRRKQLQCGQSGDGHDGFLRLEMMKVPENAELNVGLNLDQCRSACLANCSCLAYAYDTEITCLTWSRNLTDVADLSPGGVDLYLRLPQSELSETHKWKIVIATLVITTGILVILGFTYGVRRWIIARYGNDIETSMHNITEGSEEAKFQDLPLVKFEKLVAATDNFHVKNKHGQGGFGPVYKGTLENGEIIAVKRLSNASGQGHQEFLNEVIVISKLQHKNLVKLLGCSLKREEKLLVYEFMQNKSLDVLLFDPNQRGKLDWKMRFDIIKGVCRGVLYLHRDSRLKIIHRDLKASNILLDKEFNPKISDFGMARIFGGKQDQANTSRVVGTYGYMSPEYAMEGRFSEKSDVFSLGVLLLEIVSGQRNGTIQDNSIGLISYAWKLWNKDNILSLVDPMILDPLFQVEILRSIHIGLLCVQEFPDDRPNISTVIQMLDSEGKDIPLPLQPAFTQNKTYYVAHNVEQDSSVNHVSISSVHGR